MQTCNKFGVPFWAIKHALICRINLETEYQSFDIDPEGNIYLDGKDTSHIDLGQSGCGEHYCYIPFVQAG